VMDLAIHPRHHDLVIATHGRGIWIVDDISPLRALTSETVAREVAFIDARPSTQSISGPGGWMNGDAAFVGANTPDEAVITYYQKKRHIFGDLKIEVFDEGGRSNSTGGRAARPCPAYRLGRHVPLLCTINRAQYGQTPRECKRDAFGRQRAPRPQVRQFLTPNALKSNARDRKRTGGYSG